MDRISHIRLDSLDEYEADIEAEQRLSLQQAAQDPLAVRPDAEKSQPPEAAREGLDFAQDEHAQPQDTVEIRGNVMTAEHLGARPSGGGRFDIKI